MGHKELDEPPKKYSKKPTADGPLRRSSRIHSQAKPNPGLVAAKKNAQKMGNKKPVFSFVQDVYQIAREAKEMTRRSTGVIYDNKMTEHRCSWDNNYPECPERLTSVVKRCEELGLMKQCQMIDADKVSEEELLALHSIELIALLRATQNCSDPEHLENISSRYDGVYIHPSTYECSLLAAGSAIKLVDEICSKRIQNGMALVRPPGHHAMRGEYCGYCFFNNAALAARHALDRGLKRILIVDWDVHHGQATQQMFYDDPRVVYFSIHRYEHGTFWPNLRESDFDYVGEGPGRGFNFNVPLNAPGMKDADYMAIFHQLLLRVAYEFQPEMVIVSAGYDAALGCPEFDPELVIVSAGFDSAVGDEKGEMEVSPALYAHFISLLMPLANGCLAVILEGGYCLKSLAEGAALSLRALLGEPAPLVGPLGPPCESLQETLLNVIYSHREDWKCFRFHPTYSIHEAVDDAEIRHMPMIAYNNTEVVPETYPTRDCYPVQSEDFKAQIDVKLDNIIAATKLLSPKHKVCFVYDTKMMDHKNYEDNRSATEEELRYAHSKSHLEEMKKLCKMTSKQLIEKKEVYHSVYLHQDTYRAASLATGSLLQVVDSVLSGESGSGVAVVRPPGHHADIDEPCGFCIFNNVGVAARHAINVHKLKRVLILDWDVHHGNGTQEIFFEDSNVLYISVHRYDNGSFFPNSCDGGAVQVGRDQGEGFTVNIPWNKGNMGNGDYVAAFFQVILPIAYQYNPELVLVSAGFDAAAGDPLGGCKVTPEAFGHMTSWLLPLAGGRVILSLEGGYNIHSVSYSMTMCTKALLGDPLPPLKEGLAPCASAAASIREVISIHSRYWTTLCHDVSLPIEDIFNKRKQKKGNLYNNNIPKNADTLACGVQDLSLKEKSEESWEGNEEGNKSGDSGGGSEEKPGEAGPSGSQTSADGAQGAAPTPTLTEFLRENLQALANEEMFAVFPLKTCPHLVQVRPVPETGLDVAIPCATCGDASENWVCLVCYTVECGRYINEHMLCHNGETSHPLALSFADLSVWCYSCQSYIDNEVLYAAKNAAHISKFGTELPWSYHPRNMPATLSLSP